MAHKVKRAGDDDYVFRRSERNGASESLRRAWNDLETGGQVRGEFGEERGGNGARLLWLSEENFVSAREKQAGDFVDSFIAKGAKNQPNAAGEMFVAKSGKLARG